MASRWYSTVIDSHDPEAQARWWGEVLGWQVVHSSPEEAIIIPGWVTEEKAATTPWEEVGPGLVFVAVPDDKRVKNRLHLDLARYLDDDRDAEVERLLALGAQRPDADQPSEATVDGPLDPEGTGFCPLPARAAS